MRQAAAGTALATAVAVLVLAVGVVAVGGCGVRVAGAPSPDPAALASPPTSSEPSAPSREAFADAEGRFTLVPPSRWLVDTSGTRGTAVVFLDPEPAQAPGTAFTPNVNVLVVPSTADLPETVVGARAELAGLAGYRPTADEPAVLADGTPAHRLGGAFEDPASGPALRNVQLFTVHEDMTVVVTGTCPVEAWDGCGPLFDAVLRTLTVTR